MPPAGGDLIRPAGIFPIGEGLFCSLIPPQSEEGGRGFGFAEPGQK